MIDRMILKAYAALQAGLNSNELEEYICKELNLEDNYLSKKYEEIAEAANKEANNDQMYRKSIYYKYLDLLLDLDNANSREHNELQNSSR